ncbi:MAG: tetratricopeptide repeat protein [Verrucomicrobiota bacterium]|jgi:tetratricopeptide (TPR) repeat protein
MAPEVLTGHHLTTLKTFHKQTLKMTKRDFNRKRPVTGEKLQSQDNAASGSGPVAPLMAGVSVFSGAGKMPWLYLLLGIAVFWTFFPAINNDFVNYDDFAYVTENTHVQPGLTWEGIKWAFRSSTASNWHPLTWVSHMMDCQLYGLHPWGHHLTNVLLHTTNTLLLFVVLSRMTGATWRSLWVAGLFGLHPLHVQSVAWIAERKDVLSTLFWMLTLLCYAKTVTSDQPSPRFGMAGKWPVTRTETTPAPIRSHVTCHPSLFYWLALMFFAMGLMSKPMLVTLPGVLLLLDCWPLERWKHKSIGKLLVEKIPFVLLSVLASVVTIMVQRSGGAVTPFERLSFSLRLENALVSYGRYLGKLFWPENIAVLYPYPREWPAWVVLWSSLMLLGISILVVVLRKQRSYLPVGWFWFVGTLVPVIGLVQVGEQSMADRYMYVPMIGVLILVAWGLPELIGRWRYGMVVLSAMAIASAVLCLFITRQQIGYWKDSETLFRREIAVAGDTRTAHYKLGAALSRKGELDEATRQFQETLKLEPDNFYALYSLGVISSSKGQLDEAIQFFQEALKLKPDYADAHYSLGIALGKKGRLDEAIGQYQEILRLNPDYFGVHNNLGVAFARKGQLDEAIGQFQAVLKLDPKDIGALYNMGLAFYRKGQLDEAIASFQKALELKPDYADAHNNLGLALSKKGRLDEAISQFQEALRLDPNHVSARDNLAVFSKIKGAPPAPSTNP